MDLTPLSNSLWIGTERLRGYPLPRNMVVHRLREGRLLILGAMAPDDRIFSALDALGPVGPIFVGNHIHVASERAFLERYPDAWLVVPAAFRDRIEHAIGISRHAIAEELLPRLGVEVLHPDGVRGEIVLDVDAGQARAMLLTDLLFNLPRQCRWPGMLFDWMGSTGGFRVHRLALLAMVRDRSAFREWLQIQAARPDLGMIVMGHGDPITEGAGDSLLELATRL